MPILTDVTFIESLIIVIVTGIMGVLAAVQSKHNKRGEQAQKIYEEKVAKMMSLILANSELLLALANAVKEGHINGAVDASMTMARQAQKELMDFTISQSAGK